MEEKDPFETWMEGNIAQLEQQLKDKFSMFEVTVLTCMKAVLETYRQLMKHKGNNQN